MKFGEIIMNTSIKKLDDRMLDEVVGGLEDQGDTLTVYIPSAVAVRLIGQVPQAGGGEVIFKEGLQERPKQY
jgi:hypothetical protein